ncbi:cathepsin B isoform X1 [Tetranychus urticae]|uniref:Peptidase C1A papain C-terminal domain-containing protein n=1 Tax=Tetranychus urticae TaxID=32264 RepID=T1KZF2_TETUR|nr:cathepsin B isoform X1 [Tetranychus urticae]
MIKVLFLILLSSNLAELKAVERVFLDPGIDPLSDEMVNAINSLNTTWKAKRNFVGVSLDYVRGLLGVISDDNISLPEADIQIAEDIPERFDAREQWPYCSSISNIRDQGACGSCWAFNAAAAMSDRICIASGGELQVELSAEDVLACAPRMLVPANGCDGGSAVFAWNYWNDYGIVTSGCKPYKYAPCNHTAAGLALPHCANLKPEEPKCEEKCQPKYSESYENDKYYGKKCGHIGKYDNGVHRVAKIQTEIMTNGPVEASFIPYSDFFSYSEGVYEPVYGKEEIEHAVRIIGWGVENGVDYWLAANSWNTYWGDQGYFKIRRGTDECNIEDKVYAGTPDFSR